MNGISESIVGLCAAANGDALSESLSETVTSRWGASPIGGDSGWLVILLGITLLVLTSLRPTGTGDRMTRRRIWTLRGLRILAILSILIPMLRPVRIVTTKRNRPATFAILVDGSRSMSVPDGENGMTRWEMAVKTLERILPELRKADDSCEVRPYLFDETLRALDVRNAENTQPTANSGHMANLENTANLADTVKMAGALDLPNEPTGNQTAIGESLDELAKREANRRLVGVLLLSDGAQRVVSPHPILPRTAAARLAARGTTLDVVPLGSTLGMDAARDLALSEFVVPDQVFAKHEVDIQAILRQRGFGGDSVSAELIAERLAADGENTRNTKGIDTENNRENTETNSNIKERGGVGGTATSEVVEIVERREISIRNEDSTPIHFAWRPETEGCYRLTLRVAEQAGELDPKNNEVVTFLDVLNGGVRVLYVEGFPPRAEQKYIVRTLASSPEIDLAVVHLRDPRDISGNSEDGANGDNSKNRAIVRRPKEMAERLKEGGCNVLLIGDLDANCWNPGEMEQIDRLVSEGVGIGFLGGFHSFGPGGYAGTPLAKLLPVQMNSLDRLRTGEAPSPTSHWTQPLKMKPVPTALDHPSLEIGEMAENPGGNPREASVEPTLDAVWAKLPPLDGANRWDEASLKPAARRVLESVEGEPLLLTQDYGRGRVWAFAGDSTWRWAMEGSESAHTRFWRQTVLWLAGQSGWSDDPVRIRIPRRQIVRGSPSEISVKLHIPEDVTTNAEYTVSAELVAMDGARSAIELVRELDSEESRQENGVNSKSDKNSENSDNAKDMRYAWSGVLPDSLADGDYRVEVVGYADGKAFGRRSTWVGSRYRDIEMEHTTADRSLLEQIAATTGGGVIDPEDVVVRMRERLAQTAEKSRIPVERPITLWDHWAWLLLVTLSLGVEWTLRRRWGLF